MLYHKHLAKVCDVNHKLFLKASAGIMLPGLDMEAHKTISEKYAKMEGSILSRYAEIKTDFDNAAKAALKKLNKEDRHVKHCLLWNRDWFQTNKFLQKFE